ncbi:MAG TPA: hypothetical protein VGF15_07460 [Solirubrobacteraceae bacterium]|jgi:hypothetical protein
MGSEQAVKALAGLRLAIGVASWATPRSTGRLFGLDATANPQSPYLARLFGARDVALAYGALSTDGQEQRRWLVAGVACDLADAAAGVAGGRDGYLSRLTSAMVSATALSAAVLGAWALDDQ